MASLKTDESVKSTVHRRSSFDTSGRTFLPIMMWFGTIPQRERLSTTATIWFSVHGERFDLAHRPEHFEGASNHERNGVFHFLANTQKKESRETSAFKPAGYPRSPSGSVSA